MDVKFINPFLSATVNVLKTMAFVEVVPGKPFLKKNHIALGDVSGIIGLTGDIKGSLSVTFNFSLIQMIMKNMLGEEINDLGDSTRDAVGELTNMISGDARRMMREEGVSLVAAIPTIVAGRNHTVKHIVAAPIIVIPFTSENDGKASVEVSFSD